MDLRYHVVWVDDQPAAINSIRNELQENISLYGLEPFVDKLTGEAEWHRWVERHSAADDDVDIVLMDYLLGSGINGDQLSGLVRHRLAYTDVIFYSSSPNAELRRQIAEQGVQGVYCCNRADLVAVASAHIRHQLRRIGVAGLRGQFVNVGAEIESTVERALKSAVAHEKFNQTMHAKISDMLSERSKGVTKTIASHSKKNPMTEISKLGLDSSQKLRITLELFSAAKAHGIRVVPQQWIDDVTWYMTTGSIQRNILAHQPVRHDRGVYVADSRTFTQSELTELRVKLVRAGLTMKEIADWLLSLSVQANVE